jgi:outer membrane protein assembly factor BamB
MLVQNRLLRIVYFPKNDYLIGSDIRGRVHKFDADLKLIQSSPVVTYDRPINSICLTDKYIFTKDRFGSIGKWCINTLQPLDFHDGRRVCDRSELMPGEEPSPTPNRGIAVFEGRVYTNNGYGQMVVLNAETFDLLEVRKSPSETFIDCICVEGGDIHALTDVEGNIFIGNIETNEFPISHKIDTNVVHSVVYDRRHDRFWTTQDGGLGDDQGVRTGVTVIGRDGLEFKEFKISHEDNEFIAFDPECRYLYAGGFNGKISVFDNKDCDFHLSKVIGPLEFQIIHAAVVSEDRIYALLQTGDIIRLDSSGREVARTEFNNSCIWTLEPHPCDEGLLYAGTDEGVSLLRYEAGNYGSVDITQVAKHVHGRGIVKDVRPLPDGSYVCISRGGFAFRANAEGDILWHRQVLGIPRGVAVNFTYDRCMVSSDDGTVWEFDTAEGLVIDQIPVGSASYACAYVEDGRRVFTVDKGFCVLVCSPDTHEIIGSIDGFSSRLKRLIRCSNGELFVVGPDGMFELDLKNYRISKKFGDYLVSTKENGSLCDGYLYVGGYGYQVGTYRYENSELVDLKETLPDYTKAFASRIGEDGLPIILVGGRGGFLCAFRTINGVPQKVREYYIR